MGFGFGCWVWACIWVLDLRFTFMFGFRCSISVFGFGVGFGCLGVFYLFVVLLGGGFSWFRFFAFIMLSAAGQKCVLLLFSF